MAGPRPFAMTEKYVSFILASAILVAREEVLEEAALVAARKLLEEATLPRSVRKLLEEATLPRSVRLWLRSRLRLGFAPVPLQFQTGGLLDFE